VMFCQEIFDMVCGLFVMIDICDLTGRI